MTVRVECNDIPDFDADAGYSPHVIELPFWDEEVAGVFWSAVNAPTYHESADKVAALVRYVWGRAHIEGRNEGVRSILGRDS